MVDNGTIKCYTQSMSVVRWNYKMKIETVELNALYKIPTDEKCTLTAYWFEGNAEKKAEPLPALLIIPGGGYAFVSEREGEPLALEFYNRRYVTFVLRYNVAPAVRHPIPLLQAACAVDYIRHNAEKFHVNGKVFAMGFSAGGHLAGTLADFWHSVPYEGVLARKPDAKIDGVALCYAVLSADKGVAHEGSFANLLGRPYDPADKDMQALSIEKHVSDKNPPAFFWHTAADDGVPVANTLLTAAAYARLKIPFEVHVYPYGGHGASLCDERVNSVNERAAVWVDECDKFFKAL